PVADLLARRVLEPHGGGEGHAVAALRRLDDLGAVHLALQLVDAPLDERLLLARGVVLGVLREVAVRARLGDRLDDRRALDALEAVELVPQALEARPRHRRALHRHGVTLARRQERFGAARTSTFAAARAWLTHASHAWLCFCVRTSRESRSRSAARWPCSARCARAPSARSSPGATSRARPRSPPATAAQRAGRRPAAAPPASSAKNAPSRPSARPRSWRRPPDPSCRSRRPPCGRARARSPR